MSQPTYRTATRPGASGPGSLSQRTDLQMTGGGEYGETKSLQGISDGAPMQPAPFTPTVPPPVPFGAPTTQPGTPVTDGAAVGPGAGLEAITSPLALAQQDAEYFRPYIPTLIEMADSEDTPPSTRAKVRELLKNLRG